MGNYAGTVVESQIGGGTVNVQGATVTVGSDWTYQSGNGYVIASPTATATTAADGTFVITVSSAATEIIVCATNLVCSHRPIQTSPNSYGVAPAANSFGTITLVQATADELAGLSAINIDRATLGTASGKLALTMDADMVLSARATTKNEGTLGYYSHQAPGTNYVYSTHYACTALVGAYCGNPVFQQENLGAGPGETAVQMEQGNISLGPSDGHYQNVVSQTNLFVGIGEYLNGTPDPVSLAHGIVQQNYQAQEFLTTTANPQP
jgi:hypothetical protein